MWSYLSIVCFGILCITVSALTTRKVRVDYPTELLYPKTGSNFAAEVTQDKLFCFGNDDYSTPTYRETLYCMLPFFPGTSLYCNSVWGSRTVEVEVNGSIEFLKVAKLPHETTSISNIDLPSVIGLDNAYSLEITTTRWLQLHSGGPHSVIKKTLQIPAEPIYLCARSTDWQSGSANFRMRFRQAYLRAKDKRQSNHQTLLHVLLIIAVSSVWFIPYLTAIVAAALVYEHGIKIMLTLYMISTCVVCLTPLMLRKNNRQSARIYFNYFFTRLQAQETRQQIKKRLPVFQALFFSSVVIFFGFFAIYVAYYYDFLDRELRNTCFKTTLSVAISWFVFSLCRSFERFFKDWLWIAMSVALAHVLDPHLNTSCRNEVVVATMVISQAVRLLLPRFVQFQFINAMVSAALPKLEGVSTRLKIPLPYQIYEHHSLQHLVEIDAMTLNNMGTQNSPVLGLTHTSTSTGDLANINMRRSSSGKGSFTSINEVQPLVDYIDEVMEGSTAGSDQQQDDGDDDDDLGEGYLSDEQEKDVTGDAIVELGDNDYSAGDLLYLLGATESADSVLQNRAENSRVCTTLLGAAIPLYQHLRGSIESAEASEHVPESTNESCEQLNRAAMHQYEHISLQGIPSLTSDDNADKRESDKSVNDTTALKTTELKSSSVDKIGTRRASRRTSANVNSTTDTNADAVTLAMPITSQHSSNTVGTATSTIHSLAPSAYKNVNYAVFGQLIGASVTPLSVVGPLMVGGRNSCITDNSATDERAGVGSNGVRGEGSSSGSSKKKSAKGKKVAMVETNPHSGSFSFGSSNNNSNSSGNINSGSSNGIGLGNRVWFPLASSDPVMVSNLQTVCSAVVDGVRCTRHAPLQDTLTFSATLYTPEEVEKQAEGGAVTSVGADIVSGWSQWPDQYLSLLLRAALSAEPAIALLLLRAQSTLQGVGIGVGQAPMTDLHGVCQLVCVPQGRTAVLQLRVSTHLQCGLLALVGLGKALLRRILTAIHAGYPHIAGRDVHVNHTPLLHVNTLTPYMPHTSVSCALLVGEKHSLQSLINRHRRADAHDANAHILSTLRALLASLAVDLKYLDLHTVLCGDVTIAVNEEGNVVFSARVPVLLTQYELGSSAGDAQARDAFVNEGALRCRQLLAGSICGGSGSGSGSGAISSSSGDAVVESVSALILVSYISYILSAELE